ncbi:PQQ-dependent sugar dehydrogenase [Halarcobacter sp.]|uniref:PQQ-dependent sugar dehydrogenase n=1 Tax=Halarcobacter sp. TaxID=2321133 RepID=UPI0029F47859|nr:PQQ-dependent sugar dehydrogenase [Halarcobacter sp.]
MKKYFIAILFPIFLCSQTILRFSSENMNLKLERVISENDVIWALDFISKDEIIFAMKNGNIATYNLKSRVTKYFKNTPYVVNRGQGGLLDVAVSPNFKSDQTIFFTYVKEYGNDIVTALAKAKYRYNDLYEWKDILVTKSNSGTSRHFGSRITFDEEGHLFFSVGERGYRPNAQDLSNHAGTIIRLNIDGTIPKDNPFINQYEKLPEIYSYGHRNPQGIFYDRHRKTIFSSEHGPRGGDEINVIYKGQNYGWPTISYGKEYWNPLSVGEGTHKDGMMQPIKYYDPSIAPSSLIVYNGNKFPAFKGDIFIGALKLTHLNRIILDNNFNVLREERLLNDLDERIRDVIESPDGLIYISTDSGNIYRIVPN